MHVPMNINPLNAELNSVCHLLALLGAQPILHISRIRVKCTVNALSVFGSAPGLTDCKEN
jgi:hypothetical protein